ncbi:uncharacterized protein LOC113506596, partial [Trichoplusia ni]|uniref:Uncharacterized protein LOC113506596 n=1 Tax=Trichoplusia ni TaxID=7111 RepID=A0A7E5WY98_TRINI
RTPPRPPPPAPPLAHRAQRAPHALRLLLRPEPGYANVSVYDNDTVAGVETGAPPRWRPLYVQRQDSEQEGEAGGAHWWWRGCRRHARASQTLEFNSRRGAPSSSPDSSGEDD